MPSPKPIDGILNIAPYVGGDSKVDGNSDIVKLSSNEAATGASPLAVAAFVNVSDSLHRYPDGGAHDLRDCIAEVYGLNVDGVVCGNGSDEIISALIHAYCGPGDEVVYSEHGFLMYALGAMAAGAIPVKAPEHGYTASVNEILGVVSARTKIVFLANPNNPTGTYLPSTEVERLRNGLPDEVILVIDAAYAEFLSVNDYSSGVELVTASDNVVMTRTFSKIYGLAALRIGWAYCPLEIANVYHRFRSPFNVNAAAQAAAKAALLDVSHKELARDHNDYWLAWLTKEFEGLGLEVIPSVANFVTVNFAPQFIGDRNSVHDFLKGRGILPRGLAAYGLDHWVRFTIGLGAENQAVISILKNYLDGTDV